MTTPQRLDVSAILSPEVIDQIVEIVMLRLRSAAMEQRAAKLADLRAHEAMFNLPRTPTSRENGHHK